MKKGARNKVPYTLATPELTEEEVIEVGGLEYHVFTAKKSEEAQDGLPSLTTAAMAPSVVMSIHLGSRRFDVGYLPSSHAWTMGESVGGKRTTLTRGEGHAPEARKAVQYLHEIVKENPVEPVARLRTLVHKNRSVVQKFAMFTVVLMLLPISSFFASKSLAVSFGVEAPWVNIYPAIAAVVVTNIVLFAYVVVAWTEDLTPVKQD